MWHEFTLFTSTQFTSRVFNKTRALFFVSQFHDELDPDPQISYEWSEITDCYRVRLWRATDHAGNTQDFPQRINISYTEGIAVLPRATVECNTGQNLSSSVCRVT